MTEPIVGRSALKANGTFAGLFTFGHDPQGPHRDPDHEVLERPTVIFTTQGSWSWRSARGEVEAGRETIVLGNTGEIYTCAHPSRRPVDRAEVMEFGPAMREIAEGLPGVARAHFEGGTFPVVAMPRTRRMRALLARPTGAGPRLEIDLIALEVLLEIARWAAQGLDDVAELDGDPLEAARGYMLEHLADDIGLSDIARAAHFSAYHFVRAFRRHFGMSPYAYLLRARLLEARRLLRTTDRSVTEIARDVGFLSLSHFITTFRRATGVSPSTYRSPDQSLT